MKNSTIIILSVAAILVIIGILSISSVVSVGKQEYVLKTTIDAKQTDNKNQMDGMWKTISQVAQVTEEQKKALIEIFDGYAQARTGANKGGSLANWIKESVPNVDTSTFNNLQNVIVAQRDGWKQRQTELLDLQREHNALFQPFPALSGMILHVLGRKEIQVTIVTSTRTENAFQTGKDDDTSVFSK